MSDDETSSWRDDLRGEVIHEFLSRIVSAAELAELDLPHIVVCRDDATGSVSYSGPFPDGVSALVFAEQESVVDLEMNDGDPLTFSVAALYPATRAAS
jgi:hypothetical protein